MRNIPTLGAADVISASHEAASDGKKVCFAICAYTISHPYVFVGIITNLVRSLRVRLWSEDVCGELDLSRICRNGPIIGLGTKFDELLSHLTHGVKILHKQSERENKAV